MWHDWFMSDMSQSCDIIHSFVTWPIHVWHVIHECDPVWINERPRMIRYVSYVEMNEITYECDSIWTFTRDHLDDTHMGSHSYVISFMWALFHIDVSHVTNHTRSLIYTWLYRMKSHMVSHIVRNSYDVTHGESCHMWLSHHVTRDWDMWNMSASCHIWMSHVMSTKLRWMRSHMWSHSHRRTSYCIWSVISSFIWDHIHMWSHPCVISFISTYSLLHLECHFFIFKSHLMI